LSTAESEPKNFWVYNNGITALTKELRLGRKTKIRGISIINGAQTTGALEAIKKAAATDGKVLLRLVQSDSKEVVDKIIRFNNTQNEIKPSDRRSNDDTQKRIKTDFAVFGVEYIHRRSALRTSRSAITAESIGPALCAFHGDPQTAYRNRSLIFNDDKKYMEVFAPTIKCQHIFLTRSLSIALDTIKRELKKKVADGIATAIEVDQFEVLKYSASKHFIFYLIGQMAEEIVGRKVRNLFDWACIDGVISGGNSSLIQAWTSVLHALLPQVAALVNKRGEDAFYEIPRSMQMSRDIAVEMKALAASLEASFGPLFADLRDRTMV